MVGCVCTLAYYTDLSNRSVTLDLRQSLSGVPIMFSSGFFVGPGVIRGEIYIYVIFYERVTLHLLHWWFCINLDLIRIYVSLKKCNTVHAISHNLYHRLCKFPFQFLFFTWWCPLRKVSARSVLCLEMLYLRHCIKVFDILPYDVMILHCPVYGTSPSLFYTCLYSHWSNQQRKMYWKAVISLKRKFQSFLNLNLS